MKLIFGVATLGGLLFTGLVTAETLQFRFPVHGMKKQASFSSHTFTSCGQTGHLGPSQAQCESAYSASEILDPQYNFGVTEGVQSWVVPASGDYVISAAGAQGGGVPAYGDVGGNGAAVTGTFSLQEGQTVNFVIGQMGGDESLVGGGGGGGGGASYVYTGNRGDDGLMMVAGGGSGASEDGQGNGVPGQSGTDSNSNGGSSIGYGGGSYGGGGGAGWFQNGTHGQHGTNIRLEYDRIFYQSISLYVTETLTIEGSGGELTVGDVVQDMKVRADYRTVSKTDMYGTTYYYDISQCRDYGMFSAGNTTPITFDGYGSSLKKVTIQCNWKDSGGSDNWLEVDFLFKEGVEYGACDDCPTVIDAWNGDKSSNTGNLGGFGGGGSANNNESGGGGGFTGGAGSDNNGLYAGGGGSFNGGANATNQNGANTGHGSVTIQKIN